VPQPATASESNPALATDEPLKAFASNSEPSGANEEGKSGERGSNSTDHPAPESTTKPKDESGETTGGTHTTSTANGETKKEEEKSGRDEKPVVVTISELGMRIQSRPACDIDNSQ
jgi:hypothetical protein